jgi:hypothetical protein
LKEPTVRETGSSHNELYQPFNKGTLANMSASIVKNIRTLLGTICLRHLLMKLLFGIGLNICLVLVLTNVIIILIGFAILAEKHIFAQKT